MMVVKLRGENNFISLVVLTRTLIKVKQSLFCFEDISGVYKKHWRKERTNGNYYDYATVLVIFLRSCCIAFDATYTHVVIAVVVQLSTALKMVW